MQNLNPTLWRTCKMLAGRTRIRLLRQLFAHPDACVTQLGEYVGIKEAAASQELRRIQSRGLLQTERRGVRLIYRMIPDPQVSTAAPLLKAIQSALVSLPPDRDAEMAGMAAGLAHERRIRIVRALLEGSTSFSGLRSALRIAPHPFQAHMATLKASGFVIQSGNTVQYSVPDHPLARALARLIRQGMTR